MVQFNLLILVFSLSRTQHVQAMVVEKPFCQVTRRGAVCAISSGLLIGGNVVADADGGKDDLLMPPAQPMPFAGMGATLRPVIVEQTDSPWNCPPLSSKLGQSRISTQELSPLVTALSPFADTDVYYPSIFAGDWNVKATMRRKTYPYGLSFIPSKSLIEGSPRYRSENVNDVTDYVSRFFSFDGKPVTSKSKIIADRRFNSISASRAYNQLTPVQSVIWDPRKDPTQIKLEFAPGMITEDLMPLGPRRAEVYINARKKEEMGTDIFSASERTRQVTLGAGIVIVSDTETITEYKILDESNIRAVQRIAVYLTPNPNSREGILWQQVGGKSVAFFDYDLEMQKVNDT